ncbi:MAG: metallophosphoesterase [Candidatus Latescibacterota bacterium]|nr:metallophosphoesterase [Candidatus Latescibacterota bacterium]
MKKNGLIGIMADSHDNKFGVLAAMRLFRDRQIQLLIHAGDYIAPFNAGWMADIGVPMIGVFGNNDGEILGLKAKFAHLGSIHRAPYPFEYKGKRFLMLHEPDAVDALTASGHYDVIIYGHTHEVDVREGKTLVINPGETGGWTTGRSTVALLDLDDMIVEIVDLSV